MTSTGAPDRPAVARRAAYIIRTVNMRAPRTVVKLINVHTRGQIHPECEADRMTVPVFEEVDPASDCDCPGCVHWRLSWQR